MHAADNHALKPPGAPEAERAALGCLLLDPAAGLEKVLSATAHPASLFYEPRHRVLYNVLASLSAAGKPCDLVTLTETLNAAGLLEKAGGYAGIAELMNSTASPALLDSYLEILLDRARRRRILSILARAGQRARDCDGEQNDPETVAADTGEELHTVALDSYRARLPTMPELVSEALHRHENHTAASVLTGLPHLDHLLSIRQGALVVLAARPSVGKTALATQITLNVARNGKGVVFFSLEMDAASIVQRLIAAHAGKLPGHARDMFEQQALLERAAEVASLPVFLDDNPRLSLPMVQARLRRMAAAPNPPALAVLDYLQLLPGGEKRGGWRTREEEVSTVSRGLKLLARETGIPVLVCAQLNRDVERAGGTRLPRLSDLRESGAIEQDADAVMLLHPEDAGEVREPTVRLKLLLEKQREGPTGVVHLRFHRPSSRFETFQPNAEPQTQDE